MGSVFWGHPVPVALLHLGRVTVEFSQYSSGGRILFDIPNVHADSYSGVDRR